MTGYNKGIFKPCFRYLIFHNSYFLLFWFSLISHRENSVLGIHRCTAPNGLLGYAESSKTYESRVTRLRFELWRGRPESPKIGAVRPNSGQPRERIGFLPNKTQNTH